MRNERVLRGRWRGNDEPDWGPLERILPIQLCGPFMWMGDIEIEGGGLLHAYKHSSTRRYFHLDEDGAPYRYVDPDLYVPLRHHDAVELVLPPTWLLYEAEDGDSDLLKGALATAIERDDVERARGVDPGPL